MSDIDEIQKEIVSEFSECADWEERYQLLIEMGDELGSLPESAKTPERLVPGCQSRVWIVSEEKDGR
ncbi:SufE family protein, partial [Leptospira ellisii]